MSAVLNGLSPIEFFALPKKGDYDSIENKAFNFRDDKWDFSALIEDSQNYAHSQRIILFSTIPSEVRSVFKRYAYHMLSLYSPRSVANKINGAKNYIVSYMKEVGILSFAEFDAQQFLGFNAWLRETYITLRKLDLVEPSPDKTMQKTKKPLKESSLYQKALMLQQLLEMAQRFEWDGSPIDPIVLGDISLFEIWNLKGAHSKAGKKKKNEQSEARLIPRSVWDTIAEAAKAEPAYLIKNTRGGGKIEFVYRKGPAKGMRAVNWAKYLIPVLMWTGLRISEIRTLKSGCAFKDRWSRCWLRRTTTKTTKEPTQGDIRIPTKLYELLLEIESLTESYRERSNLSHLFFSVSLTQGNTVGPLTERAWNLNILPGFRNRNPILGEDGKPYYYTAHDFRHTLASILISDYNVSLTTMLRHYAHLSLEMTMHYTHLSKEKIIERAMAGFKHTDKILSSGKEGALFAKKLNEAKAEKDLDTALSKLADVFGVNTLPFGICIHDFRRGHCPNLGVSACWEIDCSSFVTSLSFLPEFEHERDVLEKEITREKALGQVVGAKMKGIKYGKIVKIIAGLTA